MVQLSLLALASVGLSAVAAHSGVLADGGPDHLRMIKRSDTGAKAKCTGTRRSRQAYKSRHSSSANGASAAATPKVQAAAAVEVKAVKKDPATKVWTSESDSSSATSSAKKSEQTDSSSSSSSSSSGKGLIGYSDPTCGASGATETSTDDSGPNGAQNWLNCGLSSGGGWTPPTIHLNQLYTLSLDDAVSMDNSVYSACAPYLGHFDSIGGELGIPPIMLAAIAMQESSCNAHVKGDNGGAYGLMQITQDKCGNAPGGDCTDVDYNIRTGANYLKSVIDSNNGNILLALGQYNGWYSGLTDAGARKIRGECWDCQQNLDYFQQMLNGWLLGLAGWKMGNVKNLAH